MKGNNKIMLLTYTDRMDKNLKKLHKVLITYYSYREAVGRVHMTQMKAIGEKFSVIRNFATDCITLKADLSTYTLIS